MGTVLNWGNPLHKPFPLFLLGFGIITAYIPGIVGASISTGWLFLMIVCPFFLLYCDNLKLGWGFLFICFAFISLLWTTSLNISLMYLAQIIVLGIVFWIGANINDLKPIFKGIATGLGFASIIAFLQYFNYNEIYSLDKQPASFFINPNIYSEVSAVILVSLIVLNLWWWIPVTFTGLLLVHSRAAYVGLAISLFIWGWKINKIVSILATSLILLIGLYFYYDKFDVSSIQERLNIWQDTIQGLKLFGNGIGSYETMFPFHATHINTEVARPKFAHNDLLQIIFEFGVGSILIFMVSYNVFKSHRKEVIILYSIAAISMFTYPLHVPVNAFIAFLVAGYITSYSTSTSDSRNYKRSILFKGNKRAEFVLSKRIKNLIPI